MGKVIVINHVTLDGVMQGPGRPDEDRRGGFEHGGWAVAGNDEVMGAKLADGMAKQTGALLLGRRTYENFYAYWPRQTDNPYTDRLNKTTKYVASRTLTLGRHVRPLSRPVRPGTAAVSPERPPASSWRITRSGRNSSRWRRRIVRSRWISPGV